MNNLYYYPKRFVSVISELSLEGVTAQKKERFSLSDNAGEKVFIGAKRMVGKAYKNNQNKKRQEEFQSSRDGASRKSFFNGAAVSGERSEHRKAVGENTPQRIG
ncbi:hypothetical protein [Metabacillus herbersteinensis]|uniref:hypothetical protein n=1 Tax=Metabacillus herbersteinensis TaxID=283816 RepID=UPI00366E189F